MKKLCFLLICVFILSCTKESTTNSPIESSKSDRLIFKNIKEFTETSKMLSKMRSLTDLQFWAQERGHSTLLFDPDTTLSNYSPALRTILNSESEFQMGDSIVWFNSGNFYTYSKSSTDAENLKTKPELYKRSGYISSTKISSTSKGNLYANGYVPFISPNFTQHAYRPCGGTITYADGTRKWVTELRDETILWDYSYWESSLYLVIKLEWRNSKGVWREASEQRDVTFSLNGSVSFNNSGQIFPCSLAFTSGAMTCANGYPASYNIWILEARVTDYPMGEGTPFWDVSLTGQSIQHVLGDTNSAYTQTLSW